MVCKLWKCIILRHDFFENFLTAILISRPNRFVVKMDIDGVEFGASLPNPGKLGELFIPGAVLFVVPMRAEVKYPYRVIAVKSYSGEVVMLDTHTNNRIAEYMVDSGKIPSLKNYHVKKREVTVGHSRFDLLLENDSQEILYCEVKSCTLFGGTLAMFPDAVTSRGKRHVEELGSMAEQGIKTAVVFVIQSNNIQFFLPDYHTDPLFSEALYANRDNIMIIPVLAGWNDRLELSTRSKEVPILWNIYEKSGRFDRGTYIMLFYLSDPVYSDITDFGEITLESGYYCYVGYEENDLEKRVERHKRKRKNCINRRDYLRNISIVDSVWKIRDSCNMSLDISSSIEKISDGDVPGFESELYHFCENPRLRRDFQELLLDFRMRKLV